MAGGVRQGLSARAGHPVGGLCATTTRSGNCCRRKDEALHRDVNRPRRSRLHFGIPWPSTPAQTLAAASGDRDALRGEAADLVFHLLVLLRGADLTLADVIGELARRHAAKG